MISKQLGMTGVLALSCLLAFSTAQAAEGGGGAASSASGQYSPGQAPQTISMPSTPTTGNSSIDVENAGTGQTPQGMNDRTTGVISPVRTPSRGATSNSDDE